MASAPSWRSTPTGGNYAAPTMCTITRRDAMYGVRPLVAFDTTGGNYAAPTRVLHSNKHP